MTLQEILDSIMNKYPHSFSSSQIINMINDIQKRLFRTIYRPVTATTYDLLEDNPFYPIDYSPENIIDVVVQGREYQHQNIKYASLGCYYYVTDDNDIGIYPTPTEDVTNGMTVFRYKDPKRLTTNDLGIEPDFDNAWHMIIVYAVCKELAEMSLDANMVNVFVTQYTEVEREYKRSKKAIPHKTENVYGGWHY